MHGGGGGSEGAGALGGSAGVGADRLSVAADGRVKRDVLGTYFEGGLQQYVLADQRVFTEPETGRSLLLAAPEGVGHSAVALVEPWACVECSYRSEERRGWLAGGRVLVVREAGCEERGLEGCAGDARPGVVERVRAENVEGAMKETWDDVVYSGSRAEVVETLAERLGAGGMLNVVLGGKRLGRAISLPLGWIHYAQVRFVGTLGMNAAAGYEMIPETGEVATGERVLHRGGGRTDGPDARAAGGVVGKESAGNGERAGRRAKRGVGGEVRRRGGARGRGWRWWKRGLGREATIMWWCW